MNVTRAHLETALKAILLCLEEPVDSIAVFNLLIDLIKWCDEHKVDLNHELSEAHTYIKEFS